MLRYVRSNIFDSPAQTLVNAVNTVGVMGKGIASEYKRLYPDMYERYRSFCKRGEFETGQLYIYRTANKWILNFPTREHWRNPSRLEWIEAGLKKFVSTYSDQGVTSISFPQLGTGNGGLDWAIVRPLKEDHLRNLSIPVYIHLAAPPRDFIPEHLKGKELARHRAEFSSPRTEISFDVFRTDLVALLGVNDPGLITSQIEDGELPDYPPIPVSLDSQEDVLVAQEDLLDLWNSLIVRGSVRAQDFPGTLHSISEDLVHRLVALDYIEPFLFVADNGGRRWDSLLAAPIHESSARASFPSAGMKDWRGLIPEHVALWESRPVHRGHPWVPRFAYHFTDVQNAARVLVEGTWLSEKIRRNHTRSSPTARSISSSVAPGSRRLNRRCAEMAGRTIRLTSCLALSWKTGSGRSTRAGNRQPSSLFQSETAPFERS